MSPYTTPSAASAIGARWPREGACSAAPAILDITRCCRQARECFCLQDVPKFAYRSAKCGLDHATIGNRAGNEIRDADALVIGMPLLDGAGTPHRAFRASETKIARVERAVAVERARRVQSHAPASLNGSPHEGSIRCNLGWIHDWAKLCFDRPRLADVGGGCDRAKRSMRIVARQQAPVEG